MPTIEDKALAAYYASDFWDDVEVTVTMPLELSFKPGHGDTPQDVLAEVARLIDQLGEVYHKYIGQVFVNSIDAPTHIEVRGLPPLETSDQDQMTFSGTDDIRDRIEELRREQMEAIVARRVEPILQGYIGSMPGDVIARALRALAGRYESL